MMPKNIRFLPQSLYALLMLVSFYGLAQPKISSFSPASGPAGTSVTISGSDFNPAPSGNVVFFGAVKATVTNASAGSLTVTVPASATYEPLSVLNSATGLTGYATTPFKVTFINPAGFGIPSNFFDPRNEYPTTNANNPAAAISDLDGDGKPELVVANYNNNSISVIRNTTSKGIIDFNSFRTKVDFATGPSPTALATGDLNGDGKPEIIAANYNNGTISVFQNLSSSGSITTASFSRLDVNLNTNTRSLAISDLDGDGRPDIVVGGFNSLRIVRNTFSGTGNLIASSFAPWVDFPDMGGNAVVTGDIDGDGKTDVASVGGRITVMRNVASPGSLTSASFEPAVSFTANNTSCVAIGDLDGDGKPDLVAGGRFFLPGIYILRNTSTAGAITASAFAVPVYIGCSSTTASVAINDMDGDERPDIVVGIEGSGSMASPGAVSILHSIAEPGSITKASYDPPLDFTTFYQSLAVAVGDLDSDGIPEIANTHFTYNVITVLKAAPAQPRTTITSFSPASGPIGSTVTITGTNLGSLAYFGAVRAAIKSFSSGSIEVVVPPGATNQPISVLNTSNFQTAYSSKPFITTFSNPTRTNVTDSFYKPRIDFKTNTVPNSTASSLPFFVTAADLNIDGKPEIVAVNASLNTVSFMQNTAAYGNVTPTSFGASYQFPVGADPRAAAAGDINADGKPDVVVVNSGSGTVSVLINTIVSYGSSLSFASAVDFPVGANPFSVAIQDVNSDGRPDLVVANLGAGTVSVLRNISIPGSSSTNFFAPAVSFAVGESPRFVTVSDLDGDRKPDIAVVNERSNTVSVLRNTSVAATINAASFEPAVSFASGSNPSCISAGDMDGDGKTDLVVSNYGSNTVSVLRNTAMAGVINLSSFAPKVDYGTGPQPFFVTTGDATGDGKPDIVTANSSADNLSLIRSTALTGIINASSFAPKKDFATGSYPVSAMIGDLDADGEPELIAANAGTNNVSVLAYFPPRPPVIASISPTRGPVGSTVSITGAGFHPIASNNMVFFGSKKATVISGNAGSLVVTVPPGAAYQPVSVLHVPLALTAYSPQPFTTTFANPFGTGIPANFYRPKVDFNIGSNFAYGVAAGELDADGKPDLVGVNESTNAMTVLSENYTGTISAGSFPVRTSFTTAPGPRAVAIQDMDADGLADIIVLSPSSNRLSVLHNLWAAPTVRTYSFAESANIDAGTHISSFAVGDLDKDGRIDLVVTNQYTGTISVFRSVSQAGPGAGPFAYKVEFPAGEYPRSVAISDVDGDGKPDIIVANERSNTISVLRNTTVMGAIDTSSFAPKVDFPAGTNPNSVAAGDIDGDGKPDITFANYGSGTVSVLRNIGTAGSIDAATFAPKVDFITGSNPFSLAMGDADGDGKVDLVTANSTSNTISVLRNTSTAGSIQASSFAPKADFPASGYPLNVVMSDLDYDGIPEIISANAASGNLSVLKISSPSAAAVTTASVAASLTMTEPAAAVQLYPNPTQGVATLQLSGSRGISTILEVLNENGIVIEKRTLNTNGGAVPVQLNLRRQPAGVYYIKLTGMEGVRMTKLVKY